LIGLLPLILPCLILGPVTGPCAAMALRAFRKRRWLQGAVWIAGIALFWLLAPMVLVGELAFLRSLRR
jgi:hypothetical protein